MSCVDKIFRLTAGLRWLAFIGLLCLDNVSWTATLRGADPGSTSQLIGDDKQIEVESCLVRFAREVNVPALETGRIAEVMIRQNDSVELGDPIARLDDRTLLIRRQAAQSKLTSAKSEANDEIEIRYAEVALAEAESELENSRSVQNDVRGVIPLVRMRQLRMAVERGQLEVARAQKRKKQAELNANLLESDLSVIDDQLRNLHTESPLPGVVLDVTRNPGEWIDKGQPLATIGQIDRLHAHALIRADLVSPQQCRGLPVSVHWTDPINGQPRSLRGHVLSVDPQALPGGKYRLHAEIRNQLADGEASDWLLIPGTPVHLKVYVPSRLDRRESSAQLHRLDQPSRRQ